LIGIRERVLMLGGKMEIISAPEAGFILNVRIPVQPLAAPEASGEQN
jgi:signal transduction histidine kinase